MRNSLFCVLAPLAVLLLLGCQVQDEEEGATSSSGVIGPQGGTLATESGAKIVVPAGALEGEETITITSHTSQTTLPGRVGVMGRYLGGVVLQPEGLVFRTPATITIPLSEAITGGAEVQLFYHDVGDPNNDRYPAGYAGWQQLVSPGIASADGLGVDGQIEHFSTYVIQMNLGGNTLDVLGDSVTTIGDNGLSVDFANYQTHFESNVAAIDDKHTYDLPDKFGYDCYKVIGIDYILYHSLEVLFENPLRSTKGSMEGEIAFFYNFEGDRYLKSGAQLVYHLFINVYIDRTPPEITMESASATVKTRQPTAVTGNLICGEDKMKEQEVYFSTVGPGFIDPSQKQTTASGEASTTFTGYQEGIAVVTGEYAGHRRDEIEVVSDEVSITIQDDDTPPRLDWSIKVIQNSDHMNPDNELIGTQRTTISGTFKVDPPPTPPNWPINIVGTAKGETINSWPGYSWDGEHHMDAVSGNCPEFSKTRNATYNVEGSVSRDRTEASITLGSFEEEYVTYTRKCSTSNGPVDDKLIHWLPVVFHLDLPLAPGTTVVTRDDNNLYSWELK